MFRVCLASTFVVGVVLAGYPEGADTNTVGNSQGTSYGYGYSGSYSGGGPPPNGPQFEFQGFLNNYLGNLNRVHQEFLKNIQNTAQGGGFGGAYAGPGFGPGGAYGGSFVGPEASGFGFAGPIGPPEGLAGAYGGSFGGPGVPPNIFTRTGGPDSGGAAASASFGPDGVQQTAYVFPENPNSPNINTQYGGSDQPGGFRSVFTSSSSHTSNIDGKSKTVQQASTTVNDNGKVTTYTAKNP